MERGGRKNIPVTDLHVVRDKTLLSRTTDVDAYATSKVKRKIFKLRHINNQLCFFEP